MSGNADKSQPAGTPRILPHSQPCNWTFIEYNDPTYMGGTRHPQKEDCMGAMKEFAGVFYREGALDPKTMQLVAMAAMAAAGCTS